jgi:hypothetical protein
MRNNSIVVLGIGLVAILAVTDAAAQREPVMQPQRSWPQLQDEGMARPQLEGRVPPSAARATATATKTLRVDCAKGQSISKALTDSSPQLVIEIRGTCSEQVRVERTGVTLRGSNPDLDGIQSLAPPALRIMAGGRWEGAGVTVENLTLKGLRVDLCPNANVVNSRITGCEWPGVGVYDAFLGMNDVVVTGNLGGVYAYAGGVVWCEGCVIKDNPGGPAVSATQRGYVFLAGSEVAGEVGLSADGYSEIYMGGTALTGQIVASDHSDVTLFDVTQTNPSKSNQLFESSSLWAAISALDGDFDVSIFSTLALTRWALENTTTLNGSIYCNWAGDAVADNPDGVSGSVTGCMHLVKP